MSIEKSIYGQSKYVFIISEFFDGGGGFAFFFLYFSFTKLLSQFENIDYHKNGTPLKLCTSCSINE